MTAIPEKLGKYQIQKELGRGAMGVVYLGFDPVIERKVAIKTMNPEAFRDEDQRARFFREARSAGALQHPGIVTIYEMGMDGDTPYIVMEYVEGEDLVAAIRRGDLSLERKLEIIIQVLQALDFAHSRSIIHRDIKPANIRILPDGTVKIMDFGIAKRQDADFTRTGLVVGTLSYMSPEQVQGKPLDPRSDQFSAGVVFFQLLTGKKPFGGDNITNVVYQIISFKPESLSIPGTPTVLTKVVQKMMAPEPEHRFATCKEAADALSRELRYLQGEPELPTTKMAGRPAEPTSTAPPLPPLPTAGAESRSDTRRKKRKKTPIVLGSIIFIVIAALGILVGTRVYRAWKWKRSMRMNHIQPVNANALNAQSSAPSIGDEGRLQKKHSKTGLLTDNTKPKRSQEETSMAEHAPVQPTPVNKEPASSGGANLEMKKTKDGDAPVRGHVTESMPNIRKTERQESVAKPRRRAESPIRRRRPQQVFVKEGPVRKPIGLIGNFGPSPEEVKRFRHKVQRMPISSRKNMAKRELGAGQYALGNGQKLAAAVHFWRSVELAPRDPHGYAWLYATLVELKAWDKADKVLSRAKHQGISESELMKNVRFRQAYEAYSAH